MIALYNAETIDSLKWPHTADGEYARRYLTPLVKGGVQGYIQNISASMQVLQMDDIILPIVIATENYQDSWVCSVSTFYVSYPLETLHLIESPLLKFLAKSVVGGIGKLGKACKLNSVVYVNDWLLSTDLYPRGLSREKISELVAFLSARFNDHAIVFRSLTPKANPDLMEALERLGCQLIASRSVFFTDPSNEEIFASRIMKSDIKLLRETSYEILSEAEISREERARVLELYHMLYIDGHSMLNPQLKTTFIDHVFDSGLFHVRAIKKNGVIDGVVAFFERGGVMMCPIFGYDKTHPESNQLYRLLSMILMQEARERKLLFNQSAGASFFKSVRKGISFIESTAVYHKHLSLKRKLPWITLKGFINRFAISYMQKY